MFLYVLFEEHACRYYNEYVQDFAFLQVTGMRQVPQTAAQRMPFRS